MSTYNDYNNNSPGPGPNSPGPGPGSNSPQNDWVDVVSWVIDIGLICLIWPIGVALTVAKTRGHDLVGGLIRSFMSKDRGATATEVPNYSRSTSSRAAAGKTPDGYAQPSAGEQTKAQAAAKRKKNAAAPQEEQQDQSVQRPDAGAKVKEIFGWIIVGIGLLMTVSGVLGAASIWEILTTIAVALGGGVLVFSGRQGKKKEAAFRRCLTVSGDKGIVRLKPLAKTLGMTEEELDKQLTEMIDRGYYGDRAYIDHARSLLVIEPEQMRDVYRAEDEQKAKQAEEQAQSEEQARRAAQTEYERLVERIRQADIDIEDESMSQKIRQMQAITEAIFQEVEKHPQKKPQIERFMNYYLPTTLKLLESYARIEDQGVSGENTAKAKADIERIADTLVEGYRKQLDTLYRAEAVDIAGDVSVIESMMRRDGLAGEGDFRPFAQFVEKPAGAPAEAQPAVQEAGGAVMGGH